MSTDVDLESLESHENTWEWGSLTERLEGSGWIFVDGVYRNARRGHLVRRCEDEDYYQFFNQGLSEEEWKDPIPGLNIADLFTLSDMLTTVFPFVEEMDLSPQN